MQRAWAAYGLACALPWLILRRIMGLGTAFIPPDSEICVDQMKFRNNH